MNLPRLYLITDRTLVPGGDLEAAVEGALRGGAKLIQLREKDLSGGAMLRLAESILALTKEHRARLLINDRVDVAAAVGADGAHLGSRGIPIGEARTILGEKAILGYSAHTMEEAQMAGRLGADLVTLGPVFPTRKEYSAPLLGMDGLQFACAELSVPVYGLGGINATNATGAIEAGATGVALISSVFAGPDPEARARELVRLLGGKEASTPFIRKWLRFRRKD